MKRKRKDWRRSERRERDMTPMQKMWASLIAIGLMLLSSLLITFARAKTRGVVRWALSAAAFLALGLSVLYMLAALL